MREKIKKKTKSFHSLHILFFYLYIFSIFNSDHHEMSSSISFSSYLKIKIAFPFLLSQLSTLAQPITTYILFHDKNGNVSILFIMRIFFLFLRVTKKKNFFFRLKRESTFCAMEKLEIFYFDPI
jgi:hypothetical protein